MHYLRNVFYLFERTHLSLFHFNFYTCPTLVSRMKRPDEYYSLRNIS